MRHPENKANILLVDDRPDSLVALKTALAELGQNIVTASSGREALRYILKMDFAAILLDVHMPGMDGFDTASMIRQRMSARHTPIIFITGYTDELHVARGYSLGAVDYILAPVVPEVLRAKVSVFVELFKKNQQVARQAASLKHQAEQLHALTQASMAIHSAPAVEDTLQLIADTARFLLETEHASVDLTVDHPRRAESTRDPASPDDTTDLQPRRIPQPPAAPAIEDNAAPAPTVSEAPNADTTPSRIGVPLTGRDGARIGAITVTDHARRQFIADDRAMLLQLAQIGSIAIENILSAKAREANRLKDEFLATLSHELRTPLNAMLGWIRLLRMEKPDAMMLDTGLQVIERNVNAQTRLIEDLLDISRITSGKLHLTKAVTELRPLLESAIEGIRPAADAKHISINVEIADVTARVFGDIDRLQQVAWNLLSNAIKFTPEQGRVSVTLKEDGDDAWISIRDSGEGIADEVLPYIFERFRQADSSSTRSHSGLGVGLAIVRHIVEMHGGEVSAESDGAGRGATFSVRLPLLQEDRTGAHHGDAPPANAHADDDNHAAPAARCLEGLRVLIVEDDADTRELLGQFVRQHAGEAVLAGSALEAVNMMLRRPPDLLVSDIAMPDTDGYALIHNVRSRPERRIRNVPAVALTAYAGDAARERAVAAGFQRHLSKPVEPDQFVATLIQLVRPDTPAPLTAAVPSQQE